MFSQSNVTKEGGKMTGLKLACLYSFGCKRATKLGLNKKLKQFVENKAPTDQDKEKIEQNLQKLLTFPLYKELAEYLNLGNPFAAKTIKAHWLGEAIGSDAKLLKLTHNYLVFHSFLPCPENIKTLPSEKRKKFLSAAQECYVKTGKVFNRNGQWAVLSTNLSIGNHQYLLEKKALEVENPFLNNLKKDEIVTVHHGIIREVITGEKQKNLEKLTKRALDKINRGEK